MTMIHPQALVETTDIGEGTRIWAFAHVMKGVRVGCGCNIGGHTFLESGVEIGKNVTIKNQVLIWDGITIEDDVFIGPNVTFTNDRYPRSPRMPEALSRYSDRKNWMVPTRVCRGCSIGAGAVLCPGIELGKYSMIAAGSVVTKSVPPFALVAGNPARIVSDVCLCGQPLKGDWRTSVCQRCGQSGCRRQSSLNDQNCSPAAIEFACLAEQHGIGNNGLHQ